jgi:large subunit ribosomal protein L6
MSRIGRKTISIPSGVTLEVKPDVIVVKGPKGELTAPAFPHIQVNVVENEISVSRDSNDKQIRAYHGLIRSLLNNHVVGVTAGYKKTLKLVGTGYRVTAKGAGISLAVGFSHPVLFTPVAGVKITTEGTDTIYVEGIDKQAVGQMAADIRDIKPPEPYKGKGIRYEDEVVRRKQGKAAA